MNCKAYSLVEVMVAAAIVAVGLTAAAVLASTLMQQQEVNAATLRAANLQEQATKLFRIDLKPTLIREILPELSVGTTEPPAGGYSLVFSRPRPTNIAVAGTAVVVESGSVTLIYGDTLGPGAYRTNVVNIVRPSIRVKYDQN